MSTRTLPRRAWSPTEVAEMFGVPYDTVLWLIYHDELSARKAGRYWLVPDAEVERYLSR